MSIHFLGSSTARPIAAFADPTSESEDCNFENWLLGAGHAIPLFWIAVFSEADLLEHPSNRNKEYSLPYPIQIPCVEASTAAARLRSRAALLNRWFASGTELDYHINLFASWLEQLPYKYVSLDWYELIAEEGTEMSYFRRLLHALDTEDESVAADLVRISTINPKVRYITLEVAATGEYSDAEMHNFFFLLGDGDHHRPPWS